MKTQKIPERKDVRTENTWDLSVIFRSDEEWEKALAALQNYSSKIDSYKGKLGESAKTLLDYCLIKDEISLLAESVMGYASLNGDTDLSNDYYQNMRGKAMSVLVAIMGMSSYTGPEIIAIEEGKLESFYKEEPGLLVYKRTIDRIRHSKDNILSPECEQILATASEIAQGPENIGSILRDADLTFPDVKDSKGKKHQLTNGSFVFLLESPDRILRKNTFETYYKRLGEVNKTIAATIDAQFKQLKFFAQARKYGNTLEASLDNTEVPESVYRNLIDTVHANLDKMYRYVELRKKMLGVDELHMYDIYTPIVKDSNAKITYEEAKKTVLEALAVLGDDYTAILKEGFHNRWIDVYENKGKRGGAYSSGITRPHPFVLLNHKDNLDSMFTLAHEMGHTIHSYLSTKNQPVNCSDYEIFVAEVASTCNEVLLMKYLLSKTADKASRAYLINNFLEQFKGTVYRQTMFAEFELFMGRECEKGETLTAEKLNAKYLELNKQYFGPAMVSDDQIALEWSRIPHFFYNYYVFQYATGLSAAVFIANRILNEGEKAVRDYKKFLSSGGSADPISLLKIAGVDMSSPEPINSALDLFGQLINEMDAISSSL